MLSRWRFCFISYFETQLKNCIDWFLESYKKDLGVGEKEEN